MKWFSCAYCGDGYISKKYGIYCSKHCKNAAERQTICWSCRKSSGLCSWSHEFKPVEGWTAKKTKISAQAKKGDERKISSYKVIKCPRYERIEPK